MKDSATPAYIYDYLGLKKGENRESNVGLQRGAVAPTPGKWS